MGPEFCFPILKAFLRTFSEIGMAELKFIQKRIENTDKSSDDWNR